MKILVTGAVGDEVLVLAAHWLKALAGSDHQVAMMGTETVELAPRVRQSMIGYGIDPDSLQLDRFGPDEADARVVVATGQAEGREDASVCWYCPEGVSLEAASEALRRQAFQLVRDWQLSEAIRPLFGREDVTIHSRERAYDGFFKLDRFCLSHARYQGGQLEQVRRELMVRQNAAAVLLFDPRRNELLLVEQFRIGALEQGESPWCLEMVAGIADKEESTEALIRREAREEAGCEIEALIPLYHYMPSPGGSNERLQLYVGRVDTTGKGGIYGVDNEHEDIRALVVPLPLAVMLMESGRLDNAATLIALQWLLLNRHRYPELQP